MNSPFLYATPSEAFATKVFILIKYISLLFVPYPLSWDYGYNQIPYINLDSISFILSLVLLLVLITYAVFTFKNKSLFSFCIFYFLITISLVTNFIVDVGTPLSERFLFQPSLAFCIALSSVYIMTVKKFKVVTNFALLIILLLFSVQTFSRNHVWMDNETLTMNDVVSSANSARTNKSATEIYLIKANAEMDMNQKKYFFEKALYYSKRTLEIYPKDPVSYMNLGSAYFGLQDYFKTADCWLQAYKLMPNSPKAKNFVDFLSTFLYKQGNGFFEQGKTDDAITCYKKSIELNAGNVEAWYNLGGNYFLKNDSINGIESWENVKRMDPEHVFKKEDFLPVK